MTLTTLIITNAILAASVIYALVHFLAHGVHADRRLVGTRAAEISARPADDRERIAA